MAVLDWLFHHGCSPAVSAKAVLLPHNSAQKIWADCGLDVWTNILDLNKLTASKFRFKDFDTVGKDVGSHPRAPPCWSPGAPGSLQLARSVCSRVCSRICVRVCSADSVPTSTGNWAASGKCTKPATELAHPATHSNLHCLPIQPLLNTRNGILRRRLSQRKAWVRLLLDGGRALARFGQSYRLDVSASKLCQAPAATPKILQPALWQM